jgi:hypothetical protein
VNILDENIGVDQRKKLRALKVRFQQVGYEVGRRGMKDREQVIPLLHGLKRPTLFTRDVDFFKRDLCHAGYCLVWLDVFADETAEYIRRFLRHKSFRTQSRRLGKVVRLRHSGLSYWQTGDDAEHALSW